MTIPSPPNPRPSRVLMLTRTPPGDGGIGQQYLRDLISLLPDGHVACCVVNAPRADYPLPVGGDSPLRYVGELRYWRYPFRLVGGLLSFLRYLWLRAWHAPRMARDVANYARQHGCEIALVALEEPLLFRLATLIARHAGLPLLTLVWDPPGYLSRDADPLSRRVILRDFARAQREATRTGVMSDAMRAAHAADFGPRAVVLPYGLDAAIRKPPADILSHPGELVIGYGGSIHAVEVWQALFAALDAAGWRIAGRAVRLRIASGKLPFTTLRPLNIEWLGWHPTPQAITLLAGCDLLYLPLWFDDHYRAAVRLSFPGKVATYLAAARPIFYHGPAESSVAKFLADYPVGVACHTLAPDGILAALTTLVEDESAYRAMSALAPQVLARDFSRERFREGVAALLGVDAEVLRP